ncbi:hypothetical protein PROFUN_00187 [Planoprotostelium fungivorum]|uniref:Uncharacterized protein n=1 Tax=Planoprotostelium fungivorum TaxID=1890364 RepID=A0A2P6P0W3_9EUKA|nr:hypothetical protein PROFUN_00187 [Planoprotostelium fungivorum]
MNRTDAGIRTKQSVPLGRALAVAQTATESAWQESLSIQVNPVPSLPSLFKIGQKESTQSDNSPLSYSLQSIRDHLREDATGALSNIIPSTAERLLSATTTSQKGSIHRFFEWLSSECPNQMMESMRGELNGSNKKTIMGTIMVFRHLLERERKRVEMIVEGRREKKKANQLIVEMDQGIDEDLYREIMRYTDLLNPLVDLIQSSSIKEGMKVSPTRLSSSACDLFLYILSSLAQSFATDGKSNENLPTSRAIWDHVDDIYIVVDEMIKWNRDHRALYTTALRQVYSSLQPVKNVKIEEIDLLSESSPEEKERIHHNIQVGTNMIIFIICIYFPYMMEEGRPDKKATFKEASSLLSQLQDPTSPDYFEAEDEEREKIERRNTNLLTCLGLTLGHLKPKDFEFVAREMGNPIYDILSRQIRGEKLENQILSVQMFQQIVSLSTTRESGESMAIPMMDLLKVPTWPQLVSSPSSSANILIYNASSIYFFNDCTYPDAILNQVFLLLDANNAQHRRNAIQVLSEVLRIQTTITSTNQNFGKKLSAHLLERLGDEELTLRVSTGKLFANLPASETVPALVRNCCLSRDARLYSASEKALMELLSGHTDIPGTVEVLLECLKSAKNLDHSANQSVDVDPSNIGAKNEISSTTHTVPQNPGMIGANYRPKVRDDDLKEFCERVFRLIPSWSSSLPHHVWKDLLPSLLSKFFSDPQDSVVLSFMTKLAGDGGMENDVILFYRIRPLLLLRLLPIQIFSSVRTDDLQRDIHVSGLIDRLITVTENPSEFPQVVRKLSAEILGRIHPSVTGHTITQRIYDILTRNDDIQSSKLWLYSLCNMLSIYNYENREVLQEQENSRNWMEETGNEEIAKLQMGVVDCMSLILQCSLVNENLQNIPGTDHSLVLYLLDHVKRHCEDTSPSGRLIYTFGIFANAAKTMSISTLKKLTSTSFIIMGDIIIKSHADAVIKSQAFQVLFHMGFFLKGEVQPWKRDLLDISMDAIQHKHPRIRFNALKLLGIPLSEPEGLFEEEEKFFRLQMSLQSIANMDASEESRKLAEQYLLMMQSEEKR